MDDCEQYVVVGGGVRDCEAGSMVVATELDVDVGDRFGLSRTGTGRPGEKEAGVGARRRSHTFQMDSPNAARPPVPV